MARLIGELMQALGVAGSKPAIPQLDPFMNPKQHHQNKADDFMMRALTAVFGMEMDGKIKKEKARQVVEKLGLISGEEGSRSTVIFDDKEEEEEEEVAAAAEVISGLEKGSQQLLHEAFKIFDENGNGFIEANELKRVLQCLGLDKGWDMSDIEKMMKVVDLNLDGMVDFNEFELMMMS